MGANTLLSINERFFGKDKAKEFILHDLAVCTKRLIVMSVLDRIMVKAIKAYRPRHKDKSRVVIESKPYTRTEIKSLDPLHFAQLADLHKMGNDSLFLSLRILFANGPNDRTSGGVFLKELRNFPDIANAFEARHRTEAKMFKLGFQTLTSRDLKRDSLELSNGMHTNPKKQFSDGDEIAVILNSKGTSTGGIMLYSSRQAIKFKDELDSLYERLYTKADGGSCNNYELLKKYERDNFHKDEWEGGNKYTLEVNTVEDNDMPYGKVTHTTKKHKYAIRPGEIHELLNNFAQVAEWYMCLGGVGRDGVSDNGNPCIGTDLCRLLENHVALYSTKLYRKDVAEICADLEQRIPAVLRLLHISTHQKIETNS